MTESKTKQRIFLFDNIKFLLIALVVVGHFVDVGTGKSDIFKSIYVFIYAFHMPLFIFLSGMLHKNKNITQKVVMFISLGFLSKIVNFLAELLSAGKAEFKFFSDMFLPWYMFVLAMFVFVSYLLRKIDKRFILLISVIVACFVGYDESVCDFLYISRFVVFYPFFVLGEMISKETLINLTRKKSLKIFSLIIIAIWLILCFAKLDTVYILRPLFTGRNPFAANEIFLEWGCVYRLLCYVIALLISFAFVCLMPNVKIPLITDFGSKTLQVYFWHWPIVLLCVNTGVTEALFATALGKLIWLLLAVATTLLLSTKLFSFPTKQISNYCRYKINKKL